MNLHIRYVQATEKQARCAHNTTEHFGCKDNTNQTDTTFKSTMYNKGQKKCKINSQTTFPDCTL